VVTDYLYRMSPESSEGVLARRRSELVNATALAAAARDIDLGGALLLGRGEELTGGRDKTSILADAIEAVFGAVYLDGGIVAATSVVLDLLEPRILEVVGGAVDTDAKSRLQELAAQHGGELPRYELSETGPEHDKRFSAVVRASGRTGRGEGRTKKEAEQAAARVVADQLQAALESRRADDGVTTIDDGTGGDPRPEGGDRRA
jgi:ribonuclease-3